MNAAEWFIGALTLYASLGLAFGVMFVTAGVQRVDPVAQNAGIGFRLIILPGVVTLWPVLLVRLIRGPS